MKKLSAIIIAMALMLGLSQCKKQNTPTTNNTEDGMVYITVNVDDDGAKHDVYPGTGAYVFTNGDILYVGNNGHYIGTLEYQNGAFSGSITNPSTSDYLHFYFTGGKTPATNPTAGSTTSFTVDISDQSSRLPVLSYGHSTQKYTDANATYSTVLRNKCALVKFVPSVATSSSIVISGMQNVARIHFGNTSAGSIGIHPAVTQTGGDITLYSASNSEKWTILMWQNQVVNTTVTIENFKYSTVTVPEIRENMYYSSGVSIVMPPMGAINSLFTINNSGDQVMFSFGNLQYQASSNTWRFATNQYDYVGGGLYHGNVTGSDNNSISSTYNGWIDLFGWGTSGYNHGAVCYQPWSTSNTNEDYYVYGNQSYNLYDNTGQADWGYNTISNGGNTANTWRTLTCEEWDYVFNTRSTTSGIRYAKAIVNDVNGVILLPDNWSAVYYTLNNTNDGTVDYTVNTISSSDWTTLEAKGVVFLPAAGGRSGTETSSVNQLGKYWSASKRHFNDNIYIDAYYVLFGKPTIGSTQLNTTASTLRRNGLSVRLVRDAQ